MAKNKSTSPGAVLASLITSAEIEREARRLGVSKRQRKVNITALVWTLVLGFQVGRERTLEALRHTYQRVAGHGLVRSAFYTRLTLQLARLLRGLAQRVMEDMAQKAAIPAGHLAGFTELLALDSTVLRLHDMLVNRYPASRTNHTKAAAKLHAVINAIDGSPRRLKFTGERTSDTTPWRKVGKWLEGCLILFDLGYYSFQLFDRIDRNGGYFLSRLKTNANPLIKRVNRRWRGAAIPLEERQLQDVLGSLTRQVIDADVEVTFKRRKYRGKRSTARRAFRLVAIRNDQTGNYHCYITNVPPERLLAEDVTRTYALRWQVELFFKAMKSHGHLEQLPSGKQCVVECLVWASVLSVLASQALRRVVCEAVAKGRFVPLLRWASLFSKIAAELIPMVLVPNPVADQALAELLQRDAPDPNRKRLDRAIGPKLCGFSA